MDTTSTMDRLVPSRQIWRARLVRIAVALFGVVALLAAIAWGISWLEPSVRLSNVHLSQVEHGDVEAVLPATGNVRPISETTISATASGRIVRVLRQPGEWVEAGEPILELDVEQAALDAHRLESQLAQAVNEGKELRLSLQEQLIGLESQLELKKLDIDEAKQEVTQQETLHTDGLASADQLRAARLRVRRAEIEAKTLQRSVENSRDAMTVRRASLEARIGSLREEYQDAARRAATAVTRADRRGLLTWTVSEVGAQVSPGDSLARIAEPSGFRVEATIAGIHASRLVPGQSARMHLPGQPVNGTVSRVMPSIDAGALTFWIDLDEPKDERLRPNLRAEVSVVTGQSTQSLVIDRGASTQGTGTQRVFVLDEDGAYAQARDVRLGLVGHRRVAVVEGIREGERVIISDMSNFRRADRVRID